jgi:6-phosphogluconolactonase
VSKPEIINCRDVDELARNTAEQFVALAGTAIARSGRFAVALSGGSTPRALYGLLGSAEVRHRIDWSRVHLFWGDERCVSPDHPDSNFRMVRESLLAGIQIPPGNVHRMIGEQEPGQAAAGYEAELKQFFGADGALPRFDLVLLGLGEDGHTASLFPGSAAVDVTQRLAATSYVDKLRAHRLTLTLPVINAAAQVSFLVAGQEKSAIVKKLLGADSDCSKFPAGMVRPASGHVTWFITQDAAAGLSLHRAGKSQ